VDFKAWARQYDKSYIDGMREYELALHGFLDDVVKQFEQGDLDIVILPENSLPEEGEKIFLSEEKATLVFPKNSKFPINKNISCEELEKYPTILFEEDDYLYTKWFQEHFHRKPVKINTKYVVNVHGNILQAVAEGLGTAVVPVHVFERSSYKDRIISLGTDFEIANFNFYIVYHKEALSLKRVQAVVDYLRSFDNPLC
jgi:DNA-binding transcriptional LysR family regulator